MKYLLSAVLCAGTLTVVTPPPVEAGAISRACLNAGRKASSPALCRCIQRVANDSLSRGERKTVAKWFKDPHQAQVVRQSSRSSDERLWKKYRAFGSRASKVCG
jgi:hypothetical protein